MNLRVLLLLAPLLALLAACETTGNPRQGGLFGWSETKARQRQDERRSEVRAAESALAREQRHTAQLRERDAAAAQKLEVASTKAADDRERAAAAVRMHEASVRAKADLLEKESPTAATASRARRLRATVDAVLANRASSAVDRARQLRSIEAEIDEARASLSR
ncbi:MAG: hypothetical protein WCF18_17515 [Chthoniobacteraceae bacterium]